MSWPHSLTDIEAALITAYLSALTTPAATFTPVPVRRTWRDQANKASYPAYLVHVVPADYEAENNLATGPLYRAYVEVSSQTHTDDQPPASGSTPVAGDPTGATCRKMHAAARAQILGSVPTITGATLLQARMQSSNDGSDGPVNHLSFSVLHVLQLT